MSIEFLKTEFKNGKYNGVAVIKSQSLDKKNQIYERFVKSLYGCNSNELFFRDGNRNNLIRENIFFKHELLL